MEIIPGEDGNVYWRRRSFRNARMDDFTDPPAQDPDTFELLQNVIVGVENAIQRRWGYALWNSSVTPTINAKRLTPVHFDSGAHRFVAMASDGTGVSSLENKVISYSENGDENSVPVFTPSSGAATPYMTSSRNRVYFVDGINDDLYSWNGVDDPSGSQTSPDTGVDIPNVHKWGITAPATAITAIETAEGTGNIYLGGTSTANQGGRAYCVVFRNSVDGITSSPSPFTDRYGVTSDPTDSATGLTIELSDIPISSDPQVDQRVILATSDGGALDTLYEVTIINDNTTTTYTDDLAEYDLLNQDIWAERDADGNQIGVFNNTPPSEILTDASPDATICAAHRGRIYIIQGHYLFWTKTLAEVTTSTGNVTTRPEEALPAYNQWPLSSDGSEVGTGLLSDGVNLYIGTNVTVHSTSGDYIGTVAPRAIYHQAGVLNQDCWQLIYHEGKVVGSMWMTPDKRVIASDFVKYYDASNDFENHSSIKAEMDRIGTDTLMSSMRATFVSNGPYEFYMLCHGEVGVDRTFFVYNVRTHAWMKWFSPFPNDEPLALGFMYNPSGTETIAIFATPYQKLFRWDYTTVYDRDSTTLTPALPVVDIQSVWYGDPMQTSLINAIELQTDEADTTITIEGARKMADYTTPDAIGTVTLAEDSFGNVRARCAALRTRHPMYRLSFGGYDSSAEVDLIRYMQIDTVPLSNI